MSQTPFETHPPGHTMGREEATYPSTQIPRPASPPATPIPAPAPSAPAHLVLTRGPQAGTGFPLTASFSRIGRQHDCDIVLDDPTVSRCHAVVHRDADQFILADCGSLNGTYVNRTVTDRAELCDGDEVWIGIFHFIFRTSFVT